MIKDRAILSLALAQTLVWAGLYYSFPAMLLRWEQSLGWHRADLTAAITLAILISAFASPVSGRLIDAGKGPILMTSCTVLGGVCLLALSLVTELSTFYIVWSLIGLVMGGCLYEPCFALITRARGTKAKQGIIVVTLIAGFASTISFPAVHVLSEAFDWRFALQIFSAVLCLLAAPLMWFGAQSVERSGIGNRLASDSRFLKSHGFLKTPVFWLLAFGLALGALVHGVTLHHMLPILYERGIHPEVAIMAASFIGPMQVTGRLAMMATEKHFSNHGIAVGCFILVGLSIIFLISAGPVPSLLVGFVILFGAGHGIVSIIRPIVTRDILGERNFGAKLGALAMIYLIGGASAPYLGSLIWAKGGYDLVLPVLLSLTVLGSILYLASNHLSASRVITD